MIVVRTAVLFVFVLIASSGCMAGFLAGQAAANVGGTVLGGALGRKLTERTFDESKLAEVKVGETTKAKVKQLFGEPDFETVIRAGEEHWVYNAFQSKTEVNWMTVLGMPTTQDDSTSIAISLKDGVVADCRVAKTSMGTIDAFKFKQSSRPCGE